MARRPPPSLDSVIRTVLQLSKDRKNSYGGYSGGVMNLEEMGPHQGGNWPFSAEFIRRSFGIPKDRDDPESDYVLTLRARSHRRLEEVAENYLRPYAPQQWRAWNSIFSPDTAGDRDYEWLRYQASGERPRYEPDPDWRIANRELSDGRRLYERVKGTLEKPEGGVRISDEERIRAAMFEGPGNRPFRERGWKPGEEPGWLKARPTVLPEKRDFARDAKGYLVLVDMALELLAMRLLHDELIADFAKQRTVSEEKDLARRYKQIYARYLDLRDAGWKPKQAKEKIAEEEGITVRRVEQITEAERAEAGLERRPRGRPRKGES